MSSARYGRDAVSIQDHISRIVEKAPKLTPAQRDRIAALLRPVGGGA